MYLKRDKLWTEELHQKEQKDTTMLKTIQKFEIGQLAAGISHKVKMSKLLPRLWNVKFGMIRFKR